MSYIVPNHFKHASESILRVYVLGPAWVEWQGQPLVIARRQTRALLYCLAARQHPVPREELCFNFWPDQPECHCHRQLSHLLSHLRAALPEPDMVQGFGDALEIDPQRVWCDAVAFREACSTLEIDHAPSLEYATQLYRGPFLAGFSLPAASEFELWISEQRSLHERLYLDALRVLLRGETSYVDYERAIKYARMYLRVDEMAEDVHRQLMVLHVLSGDRPAAMQQFKRCSTVLQRELGVDPLPETRAVYEAMLQAR